MRILGVRRLAASLTMATAVGGLVVTAPTAPALAATNHPPVTANDTVHLYAGDYRSVDVLANDSDPDGDSVLQVCRVGQPSSARIGVEATSSYELVTAAGRPTGTLDVDVAPSTPAGTYTVPYQACDTDYLVPATVTIQVSRLPHVRVARLRHRPGHLRVTNPSDLRAIFGWAAPRGTKLDGIVRIAAHHAKVVTVTRHKIQWFAATAGSAHHYLGSGVVRHIRLRPGQQTARSVSPSKGAGARVLARLLHRSSALPRGTADYPGAPWPASTFLPVDLSTTVPPTAVADARKVWAGASVMDVLGNDSDPAAGRIEICRVAVTEPRIAAMAMLDSLYVDTSHASNGVHTVTYYTCNAHRLAAATVTLTVRHAKPLRVRIVRSHLSHVRVHNGNPARAWIAVASPMGKNTISVQVVSIRARHTRWVPVHTRYALWFGIIGQGGIAGQGKLRRVPLTKQDAKADKSRASDLSSADEFSFAFVARTRPSVADAVRHRIATVS